MKKFRDQETVVHMILSFLTVWIYLFIYGLFNDVSSTSDYIVSNNRMMNWIGCGRNRLLPNSRYYPSICLKGLKKTTMKPQS
jgi:hypothetical protein